MTTTDRRSGVNGNLPLKAPVRVATTTNITLSGTQTIDGVAVVADDRVLVKNQTTSANNGIYDVSSGAWTRSVDANGNRDIVKGTAVYVTEGTANALTFWSVTASNPIIIGTTSLTWGQVVSITDASTVGNYARVKSGGAGGTDYDLASFLSRKTITQHAWYDFAANSTLTYANGLTPPVGHASFNDNNTSNGSESSDHYHSYQSYPHYGSSGTLGRLSGYWMQPDITAGTVTELSQFKANNASVTGTGAVGTQYGFYCDALNTAASNWGVFIKGPTASFFGGSVGLGSVTTQYAYMRYEVNTGRTEIVGRTGGYGVKIAGASGDRILWFGDPADSTAESKIEQASAGDLELTARTGYSVSAMSPIKMKAYAVSGLPAAASYPYARAFVTDSNSTTFNATVAGGGANKVPVWSDGTNWKIG